MKNTKQRFVTKKIRVLAMGTFDILHAGHVHYLLRAKKWGNELVVIIARDQNVMRIKKHAPVLNEKERKYMVSQLKMVDKVVLGSKKDMLAKVVSLAPDIIVLGYDHRVEEKALQHQLYARGLNVKVVRVSAYHAKTYKSHIIKQRIAQLFQKTST